jgi:hypothetical protein
VLGYEEHEDSDQADDQQENAVGKPGAHRYFTNARRRRHQVLRCWRGVMAVGRVIVVPAMAVLVMGIVATVLIMALGIVAMVHGLGVVSVLLVDHFGVVCAL